MIFPIFDALHIQANKRVLITADDDRSQQSSNML